MGELLQFWLAHRVELARLIEQHVVLVLVSTGVAACVGIPAGILAFRRPRLGRPLLFVASVAQTIPSLALFGFLLPLPFIGGIGPRTALVTLTLYALLPIVRTTVGGLQGVDRSVVDAGVAMGMTRNQLLWLVELPLALPSIVAGVRVATVIGVGTATIAAAMVTVPTPTTAETRTPAMTAGRASGSSTCHNRCHAVMPMASAASRIAGSMERSPAAVVRTIGSSA